MRSLLRLSSLLCILAAAPAASGQPKEIKIAFPEVKGWTVSEARPLPAESGGGYSVAYNSKDRVAVTIYVYNRGLARIPGDLASQEVQRELSGAKGAILEAKKLGIYEHVREDKSGEITLGGKEGPKALYARFHVQVDKQQAVSEIYVLPYKNNFLKIRVTRASPGPESVQDSLDRLFAALGKLLAS